MLFGAGAGQHLYGIEVLFGFEFGDLQHDAIAEWRFDLPFAVQVRVVAQRIVWTLDLFAGRLQQEMAVLRAVDLIAVVQTVVLLVAFELLIYALAVRTVKVSDRAAVLLTEEGLQLFTAGQLPFLLRRELLEERVVQVACQCVRRFAQAVVVEEHAVRIGLQMRLVAERGLHALAAAHVRLSDRPEADVLRNELGVRRLQRVGGQIVDRSHAQPVGLGGRILQVAVGEVTGEVVLLAALHESQIGAISVVVRRDRFRKRSKRVLLQRKERTDRTAKTELIERADFI